MALIVTDKFYTYTWLRNDGTAYYVGKGTKRRAFTSGVGHRPPRTDDKIIIQDHASETDALEAEKFLIEFYGRKDLGTGCLRNRTNGGDGISPAWNKGAQLSEDHRKHLRKPHRAFTKRPMSEEHKNSIQATLRSQMTLEERQLRAERGRLGAKARWGRTT